MTHVCIHTGPHDSSVSIIKEDQVLHILEDRLGHLKHACPPIHSLYTIPFFTDDIEVLSFSNLFHQATEFGLYSAFLNHLTPVTLAKQNYNELILTHHHFLHARSSISHSGLKDAVIVVLDGAGSTWSYGKENQTIFELTDKKTIVIKEKFIVGDGSPVRDSTNSEIPSYVSKNTNIGAGFVYTAVTEWLGLDGLETGKTMGLSAYGKEDVNIPEILSTETFGNNSCEIIQPNYIQDKSDSETNLYLLKHRAGNANLNLDVEKNGENRQNVAYRVQKDYEKYLIHTCKRALSMSSSKNLILTGGCALNCVANYKLLKSLPDDINLFIDPVSDDSGVSIGGVVLNETNITKYKWKDLYLGGQLQYEYQLLEGESETDVVSKDVAELLIEGNIVAIAQGRSEIGPRALGNRSILFDPRVKDGKDIVNKTKNREWFRPFAGTVLLEHARDWFDMDRLEESPFMSYAIDVLPEKQELIPSIVHFGKCRIQTVTREQNKHYYDLISDFYKQTDVPILFNTSFNLSGDTIAETIDDALSTLRRSKIEYLYLPEINKLVYIPNK